MTEPTIAPASPKPPAPPALAGSAALPLDARRRLGLVALIVAVIAATGMLVIATVTATQIPAIQTDMLGGTTPELDGALATQFVLLGTLGLWSLLGLWGLIQGIVAIITRRGRGHGIAAVIIAIVAPAVAGILWLVLTLANSPIG